MMRITLMEEDKGEKPAGQHSPIPDRAGIHEGKLQASTAKLQGKSKCPIIT
jgi:hypothetical protein